jgi:hypothetical protein
MSEISAILSAAAQHSSRKLASAISSTHCFQKKSPSGVRTAKTDVKLIEQRLKAAKTDYEVRYGKTKG